MRSIAFGLAAAIVFGSVVALADSAAPVQKRTFFSSAHIYSLEVDPRWSSTGESWNPLLTLRRHRAWLGLFTSTEVLWQRSPSAFVDFAYPLDVKLSDDGAFLVFGGASAHNIVSDTTYREGLRFYDSSGKLIRFVSRRDLPVGSYGISTAQWYDSERSRVEANSFVFYSPSRREPLVFDLRTGGAITGHLVPGQGDDRYHEEWLHKLTRGAA